MARGNSRAQSELVDRLQDMIANRPNAKALAELAKAQARAQKQPKKGPDYVDPETLRNALSKGPLSVMKDSLFAKVMSQPGVKPVTDPATRNELLKLAKDKTDLSDLVDYEEELESETKDENGDYRNYVDEDGVGYDGDETEKTIDLPPIYIEKDGKVFKVAREVSISIEIGEDGVLRSTETNKDDVVFQPSRFGAGISEVNMRPGEYIKDGKMFRTYDEPMQYYEYRGRKLTEEEKSSPEFKKARKEFEAFESQVNQYNSIIDKNPRLDKKLKIEFGEKVFRRNSTSNVENRFNTN